MTAADRRLRIAFVVHDYNRHMGQSRYVAELASRFKRDHEVHVFANTFEDPDPVGITYHHVPAWRSERPVDYSHVRPTGHRAGTGSIRHRPRPGSLRAPAQRRHRPFLPAGLVRRYGPGERGADLASGSVAGPDRPARAFRVSEKSTRRVIAVSDLIRRDLAQFFRRADGVKVIYHGVDSELFHPRNRMLCRDRLRLELGAAPGQCLALFVGGLWKGAAAAVRAAARVDGVRLVLVSPSNTDADRAVVHAEGAADRVVFHPFSRHIEQFYAAADVFLFPTIYETYGMVISEAMASGLPVITSRAAGAAELIEHGETGWLTADPWNVDQIAEGLQALADDSGLRQRMGAAARSKIEAYTWDRAAEQTMAVYGEAVAQAVGGNPL